MKKTSVARICASFFEKDNFLNVTSESVDDSESETDEINEQLSNISLSSPSSSSDNAVNIARVTNIISP